MSKLFKIILDGKNLTKTKLDSDSKLSELRVKLKNKINKEFVFIDNDNFPLDIEIEKELTIKEVNNNLTINLQSVNKNEIKNERKLNIKDKIESLCKINKRRKNKSLSISNNSIYSIGRKESFYFFNCRPNW